MYKVVYLDMPCAIRSFVRLSAEPDGDYATIVINSRLCCYEQRKAYRHEVLHLLHDDFFSSCADDIERERHKGETHSNIHEGLD